MLSAARTPFPEFVCPRCRGPLETPAGAYRCAGCDAHYPIVLGVPDFRVAADPWIGLEDDREKARRVMAASEGADLRGSVEAYWAMTPATPAPLARRFTDHVVSAEPRAAEWLDSLGPAPAGPWLEIGCATGDLLAAGAARGLPVVGVDIAMRWLVLARRRAALAGGAQLLVCANGEALPFPDGAFARVVSLGTLEHCRDADAVLAESARVLGRGGGAHMRTTGRYSLLPEPHVQVWGVGFVPRRWADAYVRWRSGRRYLFHRPLSPREAARGLQRAGFRGVRVRPARLLKSDVQRLGALGRAAAPAYDWVRHTPALGAGVAWVAPLLELTGEIA